jgi:hypothetical protein
MKLISMNLIKFLFQHLNQNIFTHKIKEIYNHKSLNYIPEVFFIVVDVETVGIDIDDDGRAVVVEVF